MDEIHRDESITVAPKARDTKRKSWFVTYFSLKWNSRKHCQEAVKYYKKLFTDMETVESCVFQPEEGEETRCLHFHFCITFKDCQTRPIPLFDKIFPDAEVRCVVSDRVDRVRQYCSKNETRIGEAVFIRLDRELYEGKWTYDEEPYDKVKVTFKKSMKLRDMRQAVAAKEREIRGLEKLIEKSKDSLIKNNKIAELVKAREDLVVLKNGECLNEEVQVGLDVKDYNDIAMTVKEVLRQCVRSSLKEFREQGGINSSYLGVPSREERSTYSITVEEEEDDDCNWSVKEKAAMRKEKEREQKEREDQEEIDRKNERYDKELAVKYGRVAKEKTYVVGKVIIKRKEEYFELE